MWTALALLSMAHAVEITVEPDDDVAALTTSLGSGDVITFTQGTFDLPDTLQWSWIGSSDRPVTLKAADGQEAVLRLETGWQIVDLSASEHVLFSGLIFEGGDTWEDETYGGVRIADSSNITFENCTIRNVTGTGLRIDGNASNITITGNQIERVGDASAIYVGCSDASCWMQDAIIAENLIHDIRGDSSFGIYLSHGTQNTEVRDNVLYNLGYAGVYLGSTEYGTSNQLLGNAIWQTDDTAVFVEGAAQVHNNLLFNLGGAGVWVRPNGRIEQSDVVISHNTIANTGGWGLVLEDWLEAPNMVLANNAIANPTGLGLEYSQGYTYPPDTGAPPPTTNFMAANHITGLVEGIDFIEHPDWIVPGQGFADFVDVENWDFYPSASSALRDAGDTSGEAAVPGADFNGVQRAGPPDVGAYEWVTDGNPGWTVREGFKEFDITTEAPPVVEEAGCCKGSDDTETTGTPTEALFLLPIGLGVLLRRRRASAAP